MNNKALNLFIFSTLVFFFSNCKKSTLPDDVLEAPVFSVDADINGQKEMVTTDVAKGHYMYTSFGMDTITNVMVLSGTLAQPNCPEGNCPGSLRFEFRNFEPGIKVNIDELIRETEYNYTNQSNINQGKTEYRLKLEAQDSGTIQSPQYSWTISGFQAPIPGNPLNILLPDTKDRTISLATFDSTRIVTRTISIDSPFNKAYPRVGIFLFHDNFQYIANAVPFQSNVDYLWMNGDTSQSIKTETSVNIFSVRAIDKSSKKSASAQLSPKQQLQTFETIDFKETITKTITPASLELGNVAIQWVSPDGVIWRSDRRGQVADNFFIVRDVSPYKSNENQQNTYKLWVDFICSLFNKDGQFIRASGKGFIAVAYP